MDTKVIGSEAKIVDPSSEYVCNVCGDKATGYRYLTILHLKHIMYLLNLLNLDSMEHLQFVHPVEYSSEELLHQKRHSSAVKEHLTVNLINPQEVIASNEL